MKDFFVYNNAHNSRTLRGIKNLLMTKIIQLLLAKNRIYKNAHNSRTIKDIKILLTTKINEHKISHEKIFIWLFLRLAIVSKLN